MTFFINTTIEVWDLIESETLDNYGNPKTKYTLTKTAPADFQSKSIQSEQDIVGKVLKDQYNIFLDKNVGILDTSIIRKTGELETYTIVGTPVVSTHFDSTSHMKIVVEKQRKPTKLEEV